MRLFRRKKSLRISNNVTAMDGRVIARKGDRIDDSFLDQLFQPRASDLGESETLGETHHYYNLKVLLEDSKYHCLPEFRSKKTQILKTISRVSFNNLVIKELNWLERYGYQYDHCLAVTALVTCMGLDFFDSENRVCQAASCAMTYDLGIMRVPEKIFLKQNRIEDAEKSILREHPIYGYVLLSYYGYRPPELNALVAFEHHENLYGTGYPRGVLPQCIISHFVQTADMFDALITTRPFRPAKTPAQALQAIAEMQARGQISSEIHALIHSRIQAPLDADVTI